MGKGKILRMSKKTASTVILASIIGINFILPAQAMAQPTKAPQPATMEAPQLPQIDITPVYGADMTAPQQAPLQGQVSTVPTGTMIKVAINDTLNSTASQIGEMFTATLAEPVAVGGEIVIPAGSEVVGQITYLEEAGRLGRDAQMDIRFTNIKLPNGQKVPMLGKISTTDKKGVLKGGSLTKQIATAAGIGAVTTGGGALAGVGIGSLMGSAGGGAVFGTTAGGLFGVGYIFARKGKDVIVPTGTKFNITLEQPLTLGR